MASVDAGQDMAGVALLPLAPLLQSPLPQSLRIEVALGLAPGQVVQISVRLAPGATLADALRQSGLHQRLGAATLATLRTGIWGELSAGNTPLRDGDRVELYRPLTVDPKEARRQRYQRDGLGKPQRRR